MEEKGQGLTNARHRYTLTQDLEKLRRFTRASRFNKIVEHINDYTCWPDIFRVEVAILDEPNFKKMKHERICSER